MLVKDKYQISRLLLADDIEDAYDFNFHKDHWASLEREVKFVSDTIIPNKAYCNSSYSEYYDEELLLQLNEFWAWRVVAPESLVWVHCDW